MLDIKAIILAGGPGSRFHPYTEIIPKSMVPVGRHEKPVLEIIIKWIKRHGIGKFIFLVDYKWKYIYNYFGNGSRFNVTIEYSHDDQRGYRNTGGAILKAHRAGMFKDRALIWYGDIIAPININALLKYHEDRKADLTLVVTSKYKVPVGVAQVSDDFRVVQMVEKPELDISATIGVGVVEENVFEKDIESILGKDFDFMGNFVPWLISSGYRVYAYIYDGLWFDVGSLERYKKINYGDLSVFDDVVLD
ncbi:MAG: nucleotidyltransferase family protein [Desulfurococcaceae archaeon]